MSRTCRAAPVFPSDGHCPSRGQEQEQGRTAFLLTHCTGRLLQERRYTHIGAGALASVLPSRWPDGTPVYLLVYSRRATDGGGCGVFTVGSDNRLDCTGCRARFARLGYAIDHVPSGRSSRGSAVELHVLGVSEGLPELAERVRELLETEQKWQGVRRPNKEAGGGGRPPLPPLPLEARVLKIKTALQRYRDDDAVPVTPMARAAAEAAQHTSALLDALWREREQQQQRLSRQPSEALMRHLCSVVSLQPVPPA
jgi:hypothetical protein